MHKKKYQFENVSFTIIAETEESLEKQTSHISEFYVPNDNLSGAGENIDINFIENKETFDYYRSLFQLYEGRIHLTFNNQTHTEIELEDGRKAFYINCGTYLCIKNSESSYDVISDGRESAIKWPFRIIREILVRINEDKKKLFMHGTGIGIDGKGILFLGNGGSGKTTLAIKAIDTDECTNFISNDRVFLSGNANIEYFPIPIVFAVGTARHCDRLNQYFKDSRILERRTNKCYETASTNDKVDTPLTDIPSIFERCELLPKIALSTIVFPTIKIDEIGNFDIKELSREEKYIKLMQACFTPFDWESMRLEWIRKRQKGMDRIFEERHNTFNQIIDGVDIIGVDYSCTCQPETIVKILRKRL